MTDAPEKQSLIRSLIHRSGLTRLFLPLLTIVVLQLGSLWVHYYAVGKRSPVDEPGPGYCLLLGLAALISLLPRRWSAVVAFGLTCLMTTLWWIDATYYRFFRELPSWHLLPTWRQAGKTTDSVADIFVASDAIILLGPLLVGLGAFLSWHLARRSAEPGRALPALLCLTALVASAYCVHKLPEVRWVQFQRRFQNVAMSNIFGPLYYHAYDSYEFARVAFGAEGGQALDPDKVKAAVEKSRELSLQKTPFQGMFEGRDLILIQLESLEQFALTAEVDNRQVMPFLKKLSQVGYGFRLFDQTHLGRSADGQFIFLNSLHPPATRPLAFTYPNNTFAALPKMFLEKGYETIYMHPSDPSFWNAKLLASAYGFQTLLFRSELPARDKDKEIRGWGLTDRALFSRLLERTQNPKSQPFFAYVVTMMCHHPYPEIRDQDTDFPPPQALNMVRRYLRCCHLRDRSIEELVKQLGKTERGRRTVLCFVGDHDSNVSEKDKRRENLPTFPESEAVPLVICTVESALSGEPMLPDGTRPSQNFGAQMDLAPSLGHVFSLAMEKSVFLGWNLFAKQNIGPRMSRLGTWMDHRGTIRSSEDTSETLDTTEFEVSEMLLRSNRILEFQAPF